MSAANLVRWSGVAAVLSGVLFLAVDLLGLRNNSDGFDEYILWVTTASFFAQQLLGTVGMVLLLGGLIGLYVRQSEAAGSLGWTAFLAAFAGTTLMAGVFFAEAFTTPIMAEEAHALLDIGPPWGFALAYFTFALGWLLFGVATFRARVYPRAAAVLLTIGAAITILPFLPDVVVLGAAVAWLGSSLFSGRSRVRQPGRTK